MASPSLGVACLLAERLGGGVTPALVESALLLRCPAAEPAVGGQRALLDRAAQVGVPAHVTVTYPFLPPALVTAVDHRRLGRLFADLPAFSLTGSTTAWFGDAVVYVEITDTQAVLALVAAVTTAYPEHPPYGGAFPEVVPHLTIGHDHDVATLRAAEQAVSARLPFVQDVREVELWAGPGLSSARGHWRLLRSYPLG